MNSLKTIQTSNDPFIDHIFGIIDTKIQYIDYQTNNIVSVILGYDVQHIPRPDIDIASLNSFNFAHNNCDSFLTIMEEYSKTKRLLLLMRGMLSSDNQQLIFKLLSNNQYIKFSEEKLKIHIESSIDD